MTQPAAPAKRAWVATMTPAELLLTQSHGIRPIATVSGNCSWHARANWTTSHANGWQRAIDRLRKEAVTCNANVVLDIRLRTRRGAHDGDMDFVMFGTAARIEGIASRPEPIIATIVDAAPHVAMADGVDLMLDMQNRRDPQMTNRRHDFSETDVAL